jgi:hypothetical protein
MPRTTGSMKMALLPDIGPEHTGAPTYPAPEHSRCRVPPASPISLAPARIAEKKRTRCVASGKGRIPQDTPDARDGVGTCWIYQGRPDVPGSGL